MTFLHGFLGDPSDGHSILDTESTEFLDWMAYLDLVKGNEPMWELASIVNEKASCMDGILLGYSMGGRIALHVLLDSANSQSEKWKRAVIISASAGLGSETEKQMRLNDDMKWAERFRNDEWNETISDWQKLPIFQADGKPPNERLILEQRRTEISKSMELLSVGRQDNLESKLVTLSIPILFIAGQKDDKYCQLGSRYARLNEKFEFLAIPNAGHRAPWGNPQAFKEALSGFLEK